MFFGYTTFCTQLYVRDVYLAEVKTACQNWALNFVNSNNIMGLDALRVFVIALYLLKYSFPLYGIVC